MKKRDYKHEYATYQGKPDQLKARASRNKARRLAIKKYGKAALRGKDIDHVDGNPLNNSPRNRRPLSIHANRSKH